MSDRNKDAATLKRVSDAVCSGYGFDFCVDDDTAIPSHFADNTELLDFIVVCGLSPSRYFN